MFRVSAYSAPALFARPSATASSSNEDVIWRHGSGSCRGNTRPVASQPFWVSANEATALRRLLVQGAQSCLMHLNRSRDRLGIWLSALETRLPHNKIVVALANKLARIAWAILTKPGSFYLKVAQGSS